MTFKKFIKNEIEGWKKLEVAWLLIACAVIVGLSIYWDDTVMGIISSTTGVICVVTLNAMAVIPHNAQRITIVARLFDAGSKSSSHTRSVAITVPINANLCLSYSFENR